MTKFKKITVEFIVPDSDPAYDQKCLVEAIQDKLYDEEGMDGEFSVVSVEDYTPPKPFHILGNADTLLEECDTLAEAKAWVRGYTKTGFGGWDFIQIEHYGKEENEVVEVFDAEHYEGD